MLLKHIDKDNLHHAYLIEGVREETTPLILELMKTLGVNTKDSADFCHMTLDSFKVDDARSLKSLSVQKVAEDSKKIFLIATNSFLLEAQNTMLKLLEEPVSNTHFFIIVPDIEALLPTFVSRFFVIRNKGAEDSDIIKDAEAFLKMTKLNRLDFVKKLVAKDEDAEDDRSLDGVRAKALRFLNSLEMVLHKKTFSTSIIDGNAECFKQIFKAREFLRQPSAASKTLLESVALIIPKL